MIDRMLPYNGAVDQILSDDIIALVGVPIAQADQGIRTCYAAKALSESIY